jgi:HEPN domain-containing protein
LDHLEAAKELCQLSGHLEWKYLHSAGYLSHLGIELLLKACHLHFFDRFESEHNLKKLYRPLKKKGIKLSHENKQWLNKLTDYFYLRYPGIGSGVDTKQWEKTKALIEELKANVPKEIRNQIVKQERYPENVKNGRII